MVACNCESNWKFTNRMFCLARLLGSAGSSKRQLFRGGRSQHHVAEWPLSSPDFIPRDGELIYD
jgi:hypothetical protein